MQVHAPTPLMAIHKKVSDESTKKQLEISDNILSSSDEETFESPRQLNGD